MTTTTPIDLSVIDAKDLGKIQEKKNRADRVLQVIKENGLDTDGKFMDEITPLMGELLKQAEEVEQVYDDEDDELSGISGYKKN